MKSHVSRGCCIWGVTKGPDYSTRTHQQPYDQQCAATECDVGASSAELYLPSEITAAHLFRVIQLAMLETATCT